MGLLDYIGDKIQQGVGYVDDTYKQNIPANARSLIKSVVNPSPVTEGDYTTAELDALRQAYLNSQDRSQSLDSQWYKDYYKKMKTMDRGDLVEGRLSKQDFAPASLEAELALRSYSPTIQYKDYPVDEKYKGYSVSNAPITASFDDKGYSMSTAIGRAKYVKDENGNVHVIDTYNFPKGVKMDNYKNWSKPFAAFHLLGEKFSNDMPVDINLGLLGR